MNLLEYEAFAMFAQQLSLIALVIISYWLRDGCIMTRLYSLFRYPKEMQVLMTKKENLIQYFLFPQQHEQHRNININITRKTQRDRTLSEVK
jgi:hypothetical protein